MNQDIASQSQYYQQLVTNNRYFKNKKTNYVPIPDGFVTSAGNPDLAAKYGNIIGANTNNNQTLIDAAKKNNLKS